MKVSIEEISKILLDNSDFCIYTHISPDGDAIASSFGLAYTLQALGKKVAIKCQDSFPNKYSREISDFCDDEISNEIGIAVDASALKRLGEYSTANITVCIDHHATNDCSIESTYLESDTISCSCIIYRILKHMKVDISDRVRRLLFIGLITDSDCFKSPETCAKTFKDAADIADGMSSCSDLIKDYYSSKTPDVLECEKMMLSSLEYFCNGKLAVTVVPNECVTRTGKENIASLASIPARIEGVELGVTIYEASETFFTISIRSSGIWDASKLAVCFNGGGHKSSAGCASDGLDRKALISAIATKASELYE